MKRTKAEMLANAISRSEYRRIDMQVPDDDSTRPHSVTDSTSDFESFSGGAIPLGAIQDGEVT